MRQRLGIAAALLPDPALLVLDEPANGLDPAGIIEIRNLLRGLADQGVTVFVSSHLLGEVEQISDWLVMIDHRRLLFDGPIGRSWTASAPSWWSRPNVPATLRPSPRVLGALLARGAGRPFLSRSQTAKGSHPRKCLTDSRYSHSMASLRR
jgi:ABC-2 type transport system ATP-binding protein